MRTVDINERFGCSYDKRFFKANTDGKAVDIKAPYKEIIKNGPGQKCNLKPELVARFIERIEQDNTIGRYGNPHEFDQLFAPRKGCLC